ncbi:MAG: carboxylating nicotinate-nucleotide diphosphorylase [Algicola sp.]|nr:carboxylating nicotinate-nucleotide diphosphorylase [Algicola sp.]
MLADDISRAVSLSLAEDLNHQSPEHGDITASLIPKDSVSEATIITREDCVFCGKAWTDEVFKQLDPTVQIQWLVNDGDKVMANSTLFKLTGNTRILLTGERTALNFIQTLSGTATLVAQYVKALTGTKTQLLDTRKTIPGMRLAQKYAVTCGGGKNHRVGLYDAFLIKENHIKGCGSIANAVTTAKHNFPGKPVEVEVESLEELRLALDAGADIVMLDNFSIPNINKAVLLTDKKAKLEVSGNMNINTIAQYAQTGVDFISVGALTKNVQSIDLSMRFN